MRSLPGQAGVRGQGEGQEGQQARGKAHGQSEACGEACKPAASPFRLRPHSLLERPQVLRYAARIRPNSRDLGCSKGS
jgi:hypothetical protein